MRPTAYALAALLLAAGFTTARADGLFKKHCKPDCGDGCAAPSCAPQTCAPACPGFCPPAAPPVYPYGGGPWNGPCYCVRPPCPPFNGVLPAMGGGGPSPNSCLPTHPYIRSPRDYFMYYDR